MLELLKVQGTINISHQVQCPHCEEIMYDDLDRAWWHKNVSELLPNEEEYRSEININCKECGKEFIIDGFTY